MKTRNRRSAGRRALSYPVSIVATDRSWKHDCRLLDISDGGARLLTEEPLELPGDFVLALSSRTARKCQLRWTEEREIGIAFVCREKG